MSAGGDVVPPDFRIEIFDRFKIGIGGPGDDTDGCFLKAFYFDAIKLQWRKQIFLGIAESKLLGIG